MDRRRERTGEEGTSPPLIEAPLWRAFGDPEFAVVMEDTAAAYVNRPARFRAIESVVRAVLREGRTDARKD